MPLAEMQRSGSNAYVGRLLEQGLTYSQVQRRLAQRFPEESLGSWSQAASAGLASWRAASALLALGQLPADQAGAVPGGGAGGAGYRYFATLQIFVPGTDIARTRSVEVYSGAPLSAAQIQAQARGILTGALPPPRRGGRSPDDPLEFEFGEFDIVAIERA